MLVKDIWYLGRNISIRQNLLLRKIITRQCGENLSSLTTTSLYTGTKNSKRKNFSSWELKIFMVPECNFKIKKARLKHSKSNRSFYGNMQIRLGNRLQMIQDSLPYPSLVSWFINPINKYTCRGSTVHWHLAGCSSKFWSKISKLSSIFIIISKWSFQVLFCVVFGFCLTRAINVP